ncbi:MAG TPA: hypothetical protein VFE45_11650, partial [Coriobacteriia bacterium]|nr:hypothetical protein [Coriobacteriia bacterium]
MNLEFLARGLKSSFQGLRQTRPGSVHDWSGKERRVVAEGAVGARWAGRFRIFRYEIRLWRGGHIPDVAEAVDSPRRLSDQEQFARHLLEVVPRVPTPVWGRDELGTDPSVLFSRMPATASRGRITLRARTSAGSP